MTQFERMEKGLIYDPGDPEILEAQAVYMRKLRELLLAPGDQKKLQEYMREVFAECGDGCYIELPFYANWGGCHVHFGSGVYCNFNTTFVDDGHIYIGDRVMFGPNVTVATANHPVEPSLRARGLQYNKDVRIALDLTKEWKKATDSDLVQGCIIVSAEFAEKYPTALKTFLEEYKASVDFANNSVDEAAQLIEAAGIVPKAAIAKKALPNCNIVLITGKEMKAPVEGMLKVLFDANPKSVGGKLPDEAFYYTVK